MKFKIFSAILIAIYIIFYIFILFLLNIPSNPSYHCYIINDAFEEYSDDGVLMEQGIRTVAEHYVYANGLQFYDDSSYDNYVLMINGTFYGKIKSINLLKFISTIYNIPLNYSGDIIYIEKNKNDAIVNVKDQTQYIKNVLFTELDYSLKNNTLINNTDITELPEDFEIIVEKSINSLKNTGQLSIYNIYTSSDNNIILYVNKYNNEIYRYLHTIQSIQLYDIKNSEEEFFYYGFLAG